MQEIKIFKFLPILLVVVFWFFPSQALAIVDPLAVANNKFGVHIISPVANEASEAAALVNSSGGDWGYITVLIEDKDRKKDKWQTFFNDLRRRHLIPLVRLATSPEGNYWKKPDENEAEAWAAFLDSLNWPTKNRYIIIYNEPNHAQEWGDSTDPKNYAEILDKTIIALKSKNRDFFVLNAGFDTSTPHKPPKYYDQFTFMQEMNVSVPGIFNKLDGWVSHSYPNPGFVGSPSAVGRGTIRTWLWELQILRTLGVAKILPVFITETGWKHAEGVSFDKSLPVPETIAKYFIEAFEGAWDSNRLVAISPFLLNYQEEPFDHFSFKKITGATQNQKILGIQFPEFYPHYQAIAEMSKIAGLPVQENKAKLIKGEVYPSLVSGEKYTIPFTFQNIGQSIWGERGPVTLGVSTEGGPFVVEDATLPQDVRVEPNQEASFNLIFTAPVSGKYKVKLQLYNKGVAFDQEPLEYQDVQIKPPVILIINSSLKWKKNFAGEYLFTITSDVLKTAAKVMLDSSGQSEEIEARYLLPDYTFDFTLSKPFYKPENITVKLKSGINSLNFAALKPDLSSALFNPKQLWQLLPFSN